MGKMLDANATGDREQALRALAEYLADALDGTDDKRTIASLARQYRETIEELEAISAADDETEIGFIIRKKREEA